MFYFFSHSKCQLQYFRDNDWDDLFENMVFFCEQHDIEISDMSAPCKIGTCLFYQQRDSITVDHHYQVDIFNNILYFQLMEVNNRFPQNTMELLYLCTVLDPSCAFKSFKVENTCNLAEKFYFEDFTHYDLYD